MFHLTPQEKFFLISLCWIVFIGSTTHLIYRSRPDFIRLIELNDSRRYIRQVNINTASQDELMRVPYIGEKTAQNIVQHRQRNGRFHDLKELYTIKEIPPGLLRKFIVYLKIK